MLRHFQILIFLATLSFALNVDSLPLWKASRLVYENAVPQDTLSKKNRLETHGYKTMQVTVGDGGTEIDQELRLSIRGELADSVFVDALVSDVDRKAGDQTTATLQEVDQIYFRVESPHWMLHLGDYTWRDETMGLFGISRASLGAMGAFKFDDGKRHGQISGAVGTDETKTRIYSFRGVRGQREGYAISGSGEYLSIVPESETVYFNGNKLVRGRDYEVNYAGGLLNFKNSLIPSSDDEIRIEYNAYEQNNIYKMYGAHARHYHPNVRLDISGFRLENDVDRMKRSMFSDEDYVSLKHDDGGLLVARDSISGDSVGLLKRPEQIDRMGARLQIQQWRRVYADLEVAVSKKDSNMVSHQVDGPSGNAYRWYVTSDSSYAMKTFPLALSVYGNHVDEKYNYKDFQGSDSDWDSFKLRDGWDLDSVNGTLLHDEVSMRLKLGSDWFLEGMWGYRRNQGESWNSSRSGMFLTHGGSLAESRVGLYRVSSFSDLQRERYQGLAVAQFKEGFLQPYGSADVRYTTLDSIQENFYGKSNGGINFVGENWNLDEGLGGAVSKVDVHNDGKDWMDSLWMMQWKQMANASFRYFSLNHVLQYEAAKEWNNSTSHSWVGDLNTNFGCMDCGIHGNALYKLGLTEEQTYTPIYKAVAKGTGDVRYDSLTGTFIEGVDNGDFVYEGMGRNDSVGAVLASNASFETDLELNPGLLLNVHSGFLRDVAVGGSFLGQSEDTTGKTIYFPKTLPKQLRRVSSGRVSYEGRILWNHPDGYSLSFRPGADFDKKVSSINLFESSWHYKIDGGYRINEDHFVGADFLWEENELEALEVLEWNVADMALRYRLNFFTYFYAEPKGRYRWGEGSDQRNNEFDAYLYEGALRVGYDEKNKVDAYASFAAVQVEKNGLYMPYQMMSGYSEGTTFRFETFASVDINDFISTSLKYVLRFGNAEENIFQKLTMEARAYF
ncbi:MAG: hypothetical protein HUK21_01575 [Fibrobacteraceae bacterium]|nr:hypothetical protein [Fibrobacteraceae bacterium]